MRGLKELMKKSVTWGGYLKITAICMVIAMAVLSWIFGIPEAVVEKIKKFFNKRTNKED